MQFGGSWYTIFTNTELAYDPPELNAWDRFWQSTTGKVWMAVLAVFVSVVCILTHNVPALLTTMGLTVGSLIVGGAIAGYQSYVCGKGFWYGFERYINGNWAQSVAISSIIMLVTCGISAIASAVQNAGSKQPLPNVNKESPEALKSYELDPRSIAQAKEGNPSWGTFRKRVWKNEATFNRSAYSSTQLERMSQGLAPQIDGKSMHLHHVFGKKNAPYDVVKLTPSQHTLFHKTYEYHYNSMWNYESIAELFG